MQQGRHEFAQKQPFEKPPQKHAASNDKYYDYPQSKGGVMRAKHTIENGNPMSKIPGKIDISSSRPPKCSWGKDKAPTSAGFDGSQQSYSPQAGPTTGGFPGTTRQSTWR